MKNKVIERIEALTKHAISNSILIKPNGKHKTVIYYDCELNKYMKCTLKHDCLISNIRTLEVNG